MCNIKAKMELIFLLLLVHLSIGVLVHGRDIGVCEKVNFENFLMTIYSCSKLDNPVKSSPNKNNGNRLKYGANILTWLVTVKNMWNDFPIHVEDQEAKPNFWLQRCLKSEEMELKNGLKTVKSGKLNGNCIVSFHKGSFCQENMGIVQINGTFYNNVLHGMTTISFSNSSILRVPFNNGTKSGVGRTFKCIFDTCDFETEAWNKQETLAKVSYYIKDQETGPSWWFKTGGGVISGILDSQGDLTGDNLVFSYPDFKTALLGHFVGGKMIATREAEIKGVYFDPVTMIPLLMAEIVEGNPDIFRFSESTKSTIDQELIQDPFEKKMIYISTSKVEGAGLGAFIRRSAKKGSVVAFYNGIRISSIEPSQTWIERKSPYRIDNDWAVTNEVIDIPEKYRGMDKYNATLGHILNHSPTPNAWYGMIDHPRFGKIRSIVLLKDVKANDELFCDYGYLENYTKTESVFKGIFNLGKMLSNKNDVEFAKYIKEHIKQLRDKTSAAAPIISLVNTAASLFFKK